MIAESQIRQLQAAIAHQQAGRFAEAISIYKRILRETPDNFGCLYSLAMIYAQQGDLRAAINMFRRAATIRPDNLDVLYNLAVALGMSGNYKEAVQSYKKVLEINPRHANARNNYATTLLQDGQLLDALHQYDELIATNPHIADAYNNRGMALQRLKRLAEALRDYDKAIELKPNYPEAYVNRGNALADLHQPDDALASYQKALALLPDFSDAYNNIGNIHFHRGSYEEAIAAYNKGLSLQPDDAEALSMRLSAKMHLCEWSNFENERSNVASSIKRGLVTYPFIALAVSSSIEDHLRCARRFSEIRFPPSDEPVRRGEVYSHDRIRVAYVSGDFREHPIAYLMTGLFEHHDRSRFEVTAVSFSPDQETDTTRRLKAAFEHFIDVRAKSDQEVAALMREREIDIAVDLVGFLEGARTNIFARRAAPVQVNYLGYPGTIGAKYFDYIVGDPTVIPRQDFRYYTESVVWLPDTYLATDGARSIAKSTPTRWDLNLPDDGFVFCCFNQSYKINPAIFEVWMRLLREVEGSVLWLREHKAVASDNLRSEARQRGVAAERLIFAPRAPLAADHLARQRQADLFLDTLPYNAHTTATEAIWAGLPMITCMGSSFGGRVAASINRAVGMTELVAKSLLEYEALALKIAKDPTLCLQLKDKLAHNRQTYPLFDTAQFTRHIEAAYKRMWQTYRQGRPPASFAVKRDNQICDL